MPAKSILVVDDDSEIQKALSKTLTKEHYSVSVAANTQEALLKLHRDGSFNLVITDLSMPGDSGLKFVETLKKIAPRTPVVVLTAFGDWQSYGEAMALGVSEFLSKPIESDELLQVVHRAMGD